MGQLGFYFDASSCIGCRACQVSCKDKNRLNVGVIYRKVNSYSVGEFPNVRAYHYSASCNHCAAPACVEKCPTGAMYVAKDGTVLHDDSACIGCKTCMEACPYKVPQFIEEKGIVGKCDACAFLRAKGEKPACVDTCVMRCLDFGDLDELKKKYGNDLVSEIPILPKASKTTPSLLIKTKEVVTEKNFKEMIL